jgi:hypothetical protein
MANLVPPYVEIIPVLFMRSYDDDDDYDHEGLDTAHAYFLLIEYKLHLSLH